MIEAAVAISAPAIADDFGIEEFAGLGKVRRWLARPSVRMSLSAGITLSLAAALLSWRSWKATREEHPGGADALLEAGEGRTRFLAACGMMNAIGFAAAILFTLIAVLTVPPCMD